MRYFIIYDSFVSKIKKHINTYHNEVEGIEKDYNIIMIEDFMKDSCKIT